MKNSSRSVRRDRQKAYAFEQRVIDVLRLFKNPAIELQPGQLAINEALRTVSQVRDARRDRRGNLLARNFFRNNSGLRHVDNRCERLTRGLRIRCRPTNGQIPEIGSTRPASIRSRERASLCRSLISHYRVIPRRPQKAPPPTRVSPAFAGAAPHHRAPRQRRVRRRMSVRCEPPNS